MISPDPDWWRQAVVYQIYPRSFADSNGDGIGDLRGVTSRIDYLVSLGVDAVWLSPFYPSALADGGYDVDDYRDVDPKVGSLADFDEMSSRLHEAGIRLVVDIVPNHSSNRHVWFTEALASPPGSPARGRYIFRDGSGAGKAAEPPTDWQSNFGGSLWTRVDDGQWYLHLFAPEQPDLNWANREVRDDFLTTLRFWSDRGVDGFRVDVADLLAKDLSEPLPAAAELDSFPAGSHPFHDRDEVHEIYAEWRAVFDEYSPPRTAVAEVWVGAARRARYATSAGLGQAFNFDLLRASWNRDALVETIATNLGLTEQSGSSSTWVLSNHDVVRHASRYGLPQAGEAETRELTRTWLLSNGSEPPMDAELGLRRARAATLLMLALPGSAYLYQGEELGLHEVADLPEDALQDPVFSRTGGKEKGRDGCRVPLPWTVSGESYGFGDGAAHLPQPDWFGKYSVEAEELDPHSTLRLYRRAIELRRSLEAAESLDWVESAESVVHLVRPGGWHSVTNFGPEPVALPAGAILFSSGPLEGDNLPTDTTAWLLAPS